MSLKQKLGNIALGVGLATALTGSGISIYNGVKFASSQDEVKEFMSRPGTMITDGKRTYDLRSTKGFRSADEINADVLKYHSNARLGLGLTLTGIIVGAGSLIYLKKQEEEADE